MSDPDRAALLLIDMQEAYFEAPELAARRIDLVRATSTLVEAARGAGAPIVHVRTEHARDRSTWTLNMLTDDQGFAFTGTEQAAPLAELAPALSGPDTWDVVKTRDNAFLHTDLGDLLTRLGVRDLVVAGVSTHTCVATTVQHAYALNHHCHLVTDAIASARPDLHGSTIHLLVEEFRLPLASSHDLLTCDWTPPQPA